MEWRVFVPLVDSAGDDPLSQQLSDLLTGATKDLERVLFASADVESRADDYVVVTKHVGLKFRHGKKLEIKYLKQAARNGVEAYAKRKFKKDALCDQIPSVLEHLVNQGYHLLEDAKRQLEKSESVNVSKSRVNVVGTVEQNLLEFAKIGISFSPEIVSTENQGYLVPTIRSWISIAVEGEREEDIQRELHENVAIRRFLAQIAQANNLSAQHPDGQLRSNFCSILGGYPFFVQYITGKAHARDLEDSLLLLQSFAV